MLVCHWLPAMPQVHSDTKHNDYDSSGNCISPSPVSLLRRLTSLTSNASSWPRFVRHTRIAPEQLPCSTTPEQLPFSTTDDWSMSLMTLHCHGGQVSKKHLQKKYSKESRVSSLTHFPSLLHIYGSNLLHPVCSFPKKLFPFAADCLSSFWSHLVITLMSV